MKGKSTQANGTDAKELFIKYFGKMMENSAQSGYDGQSTKRDDFGELYQDDASDLREVVMNFSIEFMNMFNLGIRQVGDNFFIDRVGRVGRPKGAKNRTNHEMGDREAMLIQSQPTKQQPQPNEGKALTSAYMKQEELDILQEDVFGSCPNCKVHCLHEPHAEGYVRCPMCKMVHKEDDVK